MSLILEDYIDVFLRCDFCAGESLTMIQVADKFICLECIQHGKKKCDA